MTSALWALPALPFVVGVLLLAAGRLPSRIGGALAIPAGIATGALTLGLAIVVCRQRPSVHLTWVPELDMNLSMRVDGLNIPLVLLTAGVGLLVLLHALVDLPRIGTRTSYAGCVLLTVAGALLAFLTDDLVLFFLAFEIVLVPMWFLIAKFGDPRDTDVRDRAARLFILYSVLGSTLMLVGILTAVHLAGTSDMALFAARVPQHSQVLVAVLLLVGLAIKVPIWPLHSWLPAAHTAAPTGGSMLLAAVLLKLGTYGIVRMIVPMHHGWQVVAPAVAVLAVVGILWAGLICLVEPGLKRLIAWSSVAHMGFVVLGAASGSVLGLQAAMFGNVAHGVASALLFAVVGGIKLRWHGDDLRMPRVGLRDAAPRLGFAVLVGLAAALGLPALAPFWGEFLAILSSWSPEAHHGVALFRVLAVLAALGGVLAVAYAARVLRRVWAGSREQGDDDVVDAGLVEGVVLGALVAAVIVLGVWPSLVLDLTAPVVRVLAGGN